MTNVGKEKENIYLHCRRNVSIHAIVKRHFQFFKDAIILLIVYV